MMNNKDKRPYISYDDTVCLESVVNWFIFNTDTLRRIDCNRTSTIFNKKYIIGEITKINDLQSSTKVIDFNAKNSINIFFSVSLYKNDNILKEYLNNIDKVKRANIAYLEGFNDIGLYSDSYDNTNLIYLLESNFLTELNDPDFYVDLYNLDKDFIENNLNKQELADYMRNHLPTLMERIDDPDRLLIELKYDIQTKLNDKVKNIMNSQVLPRLKKVVDQLDNNIKDVFIEKMSVNTFNKAYKIEE